MTNQNSNSPAPPEQTLSLSMGQGMTDLEAIALGRSACATLLWNRPDIRTYDPLMLEIAIARLGGLIAQATLVEGEGV